MKIGYAAALALACVAGAQTASADDGVYLRLDTGWSFSRDAGKDLDDDVGSSAIVGGGVGYKYKWLRGDVTLAYRGGYDIDSTYTYAALGETRFKGDVSSFAAMANVYADLTKYGRFTPYVGGGIGVSRNKVGDVDISAASGTGTLDGDTKTSFAWQLSLGTGIEVAPAWTVDVGYRYIDLGTAKSGTTVTSGSVSRDGSAQEGDLRAHELILSARYQF